MDPVLSGVMGTILVFVLLSVGMPIAFSMMLAGFLGISFLTSVDAALPVLARTVYETSSHYPYTVIPLFVVMGGFAGSSGMTRQLYAAFDKWLRVLPGGLGSQLSSHAPGLPGFPGPLWPRRQPWERWPFRK